MLFSSDHIFFKLSFSQLELTIPKKKMTERQEHEFNHLKTTDVDNASLADYAKVHDIKVKDFYQCKSCLIKLGHAQLPENKEALVKPIRQ